MINYIYLHVGSYTIYSKTLSLSLSFCLLRVYFYLNEYKVVDYLAYFKQDYIHILLVEQAYFINIFHEWDQSDHAK